MCTSRICCCDASAHCTQQRATQATGSHEHSARPAVVGDERKRQHLCMHGEWRRASACNISTLAVRLRPCQAAALPQHSMACKTAAGVGTELPSGRQFTSASIPLWVAAAASL